MPTRLDMRRALAVAVGVALSALAVSMGPIGVANAQTAEVLAPSLSPNRLHAKGALTVTINLSGGELGVPPPMRKASLKLPFGLGLSIPSLRSCSAARLEARGARGCPARSKIGSGQAVMEARVGSQLIVEHIALGIFLGSLEGFQPTFEVLGEGVTPLQKRVVLNGTVIPDHAPYGEELVMNIPAVPTLPLEPDASITTLTLTVGTTTHRLARGANTIVVPGSCPIGGFSFAAEFLYADGSTGSALATSPCPQ